MRKNIKTSSAKGFTLIELMISIALIAIIASLAAPSFTTMIATQRIKGLANEIMTDLSFAKMESVQKNKCVAVDFTATGYTIKILSPYPATHPCATATATTLTIIKTVSIESNNSITPSAGTNVEVIFDPVRTTATISEANANIAISNTNASTRSLKIMVSTMGRSEICSPGATITGFKPC